jgi:hypothetical protein
MVEMLEGPVVHVPMPLIGWTIPKMGIWPAARPRKSSVVELLVVGECVVNAYPLLRLF